MRHSLVRHENVRIGSTAACSDSLRLFQVGDLLC